MPSPRPDEGRRQPSQTVRSAGRFLDSVDATQLQEQLDRKYALRLQQEEEDQYRSLYEQLRAAASPSAAHHQSIDVQRRASAGTQDDPINLYSDTDLDPHEPMDIEPDDWNWKPSNDADPTQTNLDAEFAQLIQEEEEEESTQQAPVGLRTCAVCSDDHHISELPSLADCAHPPRTCADCYSSWVTAQLQSNGWSEAECPESECKIKLSYYEVQHIATPEIFQQYDTYITRAAISEDRKSQHPRIHPISQTNLILPTSEFPLVPSLRLGTNTR
jgi:hypothetical protein